MFYNKEINLIHTDNISKEFSTRKIMTHGNFYRYKNFNLNQMIGIFSIFIRQCFLSTQINFTFQNYLTHINSLHYLTTVTGSASQKITPQAMALFLKFLFVPRWIKRCNYLRPRIYTSLSFLSCYCF